MKKDEFDSFINKEIDILSNTLPSVIYAKNYDVVPSDIEFAAIFTFLEYERRRNDKLNKGFYVSFVKFLWPIIIIQSDPEKYLFIDRLNFFSLQFKIYETNELPQLSKLKGSDDKDLNIINRNIEFVKKILNDIYAYNKKINGLIEPEIVKGILGLIRLGNQEYSNFGTKLQSDIEYSNPSKITKEYSEYIKKFEELIIAFNGVKNYFDNCIIHINDLITDLNNDRVNRKYEKKTIDLDTLYITRKKLQEIIDRINHLLRLITTERNNLNRWSVSGTKFGLILPVIKIWFPLYVAEIKMDKNNIQWIVVPPLIMQPNTEREIPIDVFHPSFLTSMKDRIENNFRYLLKYIPKSSKINLFEESSISKLMIDGFKKLVSEFNFQPRLIEHVKNKWLENLKLEK